MPSAGTSPIIPAPAGIVIPAKAGIQVPAFAATSGGAKVMLESIIPSTGEAK